jgi:hypothetical protein
MAKSLKEIFGLREMPINVPDKDVPALRTAIDVGVKTGTLPADAAAWLPQTAKGTPATGVDTGASRVGKPIPANQDPKRSGKGTPPPPVPTAQQARSPGSGKALGGWAAWKEKNPGGGVPPTSAAPPTSTTKSASAWDKLATSPAVAPPPKSKGMFDPESGADADFPQFGDAPKSANVKLNKFGHPVADTGEPDMFAGSKKQGALSKVFGKKGDKAPEPMAMQPKKGALSRVFGKKQQKFADDPYAIDQQPRVGPDWQSGADPFQAEPQKFKKPAPLTGDGEESGEDTMADLDTFLRKNPTGGTKAMGDLKKDIEKNPKPAGGPSAGQDAMRDLNWDLKRSKGKR